MPDVCFYFQVHQPYRLRRYGFFDVGRRHDWFDDDLNERVMRKVAHTCYLPANRRMLELIRHHEGRFRIAFSLSGVALEQMEAWAPEVLVSFRALVETGCVELLGETSHHSLASLADEAEFRLQVEAHADRLERTFGRRPTFFRNTELVYDDRIGEVIADLGFQGVAAEGADDILGGSSPSFVYRHPRRRLAILPKSYRFSDDIAFRFSNAAWPEWPLTADKFAGWLHRVAGDGDVVGLFMDYETFGEHQWDVTGIFEFLEALPGEVLRDPRWGFLTPTEAVTRYPPARALPFRRTVSWADSERDVTAWLGNDLQRDAFEQLYALAPEVHRRNNPATTDLWRRLQTSDHLYYMCTKWFADGDVHAYFSPFDSPYDAYISYMNVLADLRRTVLWAPAAAGSPLAP